MPTPQGTVVASPSGLWSAVVWSDPLLGGARWHLEGDRYVPHAPLPAIPPGVDGVRALQVGAGGAVEAWVSRSGALTRLRAADDGWTATALARTAAWDDEGTVFTQDAVQVYGRQRWQSPRLPEDASPTFDEGPQGPLFVSLEEGRLRTWYAGTRITAVLPTSTPVDPAACQKTTCEQRLLAHEAPWSGRLAFDARGPVVPIVETTITAQLTCTPAPLHPCDPVRSAADCPQAPQLDCRGPSTRTRALYLLRGGALAAVPLPVEPYRVLDTHIVGAETWLLLQSAAEGLLLVRLDAAGPARSVDYPQRAVPASVALADLQAVGFRVGRSANDSAPLPVWSGAGLQTGGTAGAGWVELSLPVLAGPMRLSASAEVPAWDAPCGAPELYVYAGEQVRLKLGGERLALELPARGTTSRIEAPAQGAHTWALVVEDGQVVVEVDGAEVHRADRRAEATAGYFSAGQRESCGMSALPEVLWTGFAVAPRDAEE